MISGALAGTTCIDVSGHVAGPYATSLLGDLGCEVIRTELPGGGLIFEFAGVQETR
jgi:crotonobetainyl-CoA:carnitine CoA-transferase CaiB-like acyl-CoA transferase